MARLVCQSCSLLCLMIVFSIQDKKEPFYSIKEDKDEQKEFETGPLSVLMHSVKHNTQVRPQFTRPPANRSANIDSDHNS